MFLNGPALRQDMFNHVIKQAVAENSLRTAPLTRLSKKYGDLWWFHGQHDAPPLGSENYIMHTTVGEEWFGRKTSNIKKYLLREYKAWFVERPLYEGTSEKYMKYINAALLRGVGGDRLPLWFEHRELASSIGVAISLNRTLILPYVRCAPGNQSMIAANGACFPYGLKFAGVCDKLHSDPGLRARQTNSDTGLYPCRWGHLSILQGNASAGWSSWGFDELAYVVDNLWRIREASFSSNARVNPALTHSTSLLDVQAIEGQLKLVTYRNDLDNGELLDRVAEIVDSQVKTIQPELNPLSSKQLGRLGICTGEELRTLSAQVSDGHGLLHFIGTSHWFKGFARGTPDDILFRAVLDKLALSKWYMHV